MEKRQDTDRLETDRMTELSQAVVSANCTTEECDVVDTNDAEDVREEDAEDVREEDAEDVREEEVFTAKDPNDAVEAVDEAAELGEDIEALGPQQRLGRSLRNKRDELEMGLEEIARTTKIPKASLSHIEAGRFDSLPGDVFARGFLRSYARCVGMDGDEIVRRYAQCGLSPAPVSSDLADAVLGGRRKPTQRRARGTAGSKPKTTAPSASSEAGSADGNAVRKVLRDAFDLGQHVRSGLSRTAPKKSTGAREDVSDVSEVEAAECKSVVREKRNRTFVPPNFDYENDMTHRGPLTLGVIILVIVATLTMSYLLRRPGTSTDGFTQNAPSMLDSQEERAAHPFSPMPSNTFHA